MDTNQLYQPIVMTHEGEPMAAIIDYEALEILRPFLDDIQAAREAGHMAQPLNWIQMCAELLAGGKARVCEEVPA